MARIMSESTKYELAKELGFAHKVRNGDWGNITTREAGLLVKEAIRRAEEGMAAKRMSIRNNFNNNSNNNQQ